MYGAVHERITFEVVKLTAKKVGKCPTCGKRVTRSRTFEGTLNPWNVNASGNPKTRQEVRDDLQAKSLVWSKEPINDHC